jgi:aminopeptidase N
LDCWGIAREARSGRLTDAERVWLEHLIAHEVGHQWWGSLGASDDGLHAFMVEGLTEYLVVVHLALTQDETAAQRALIQDVAGPNVDLLVSYGNAVADLSAVDEDEEPAYASPFIYGKAALGFLAIHQALGDEAFFAALHGYAERHAFGFAGPADLRGAFADASDESIDEIWRFWFEEDDATADDLRDLIRAA